MLPQKVSVVEDTWGRSIVYAVRNDQGDTSDSGQELPSQVLDDLSKDTLGSIRRRSTASKLTSSCLDLEIGGTIQATLFNEDPAACSLQRFEAVLFATILEDTIIQLRIIDSCNSEMRVTRTLEDMERLLDVKYGVEDTGGPIDELEGVDHTNMHGNKFKLIKLQKDRDNFSGLMKKTYEELALKFSFSDLRRAVRDVIVERELAACVVQEEMMRRTKRRELARQLRQQRVLNQSQASEQEAAMSKLKNEIEDVTLNGDIRLRYVSNWQNSRTEQHSWLLSADEAVPGDSIGALKNANGNEQRVHWELENLISAEIEETLAKIEEWMERHERDTEELDLKIQLKKSDYQNARDRREFLEQSIEEHSVAIEAWKSFKERREKERQFRETMTRSAVSVQAWWRGLLVRGQLGPYRPPKKGRAKKK